MEIIQHQGLLEIRHTNKCRMAVHYIDPLKIFQLSYSVPDSGPFEVWIRIDGSTLPLPGCTKNDFIKLSKLVLNARRTSYDPKARLYKLHKSGRWKLQPDPGFDNARSDLP